MDFSEINETINEIKHKYNYPLFIGNEMYYQISEVETYEEGSEEWGDEIVKKRGCFAFPAKRLIVECEIPKGSDTEWKLFYNVFWLSQDDDGKNVMHLMEEKENKIKTDSRSREICGIEKFLEKYNAYKGGKW